MAREGLSALLCAGVVSILVFVPSSAQSGPVEEREAIAARLAVQTALQHGRELVTRGTYETAVHLLERELSRINGNRDYLAVLREAYRGYVKELRKANKDAEAEIYYRRLVILDPGASLDAGANRTTAPAPQPATKVQAPEQSKPGPVARGKLDDPFRPENSREYKDARAQLEKAEQEFATARYEAAGRLFEQAHQLDKHAFSDDARMRWGYCKLFRPSSM